MKVSLLYEALLFRDRANRFRFCFQVSSVSRRKSESLRSYSIKYIL